MTLEQYSNGGSGTVTYIPPNYATPQDAALRRLAEWAHSAEAAHQIAETLVRTSFVPEAFRGKAGDATAAILAGLECGLQPMAALRSFDVIQGQAAPRALTLRAIVQAAGHELVLEESTATQCRMKGRRAGTTAWQTVRWTIDRAKSLNLTGKQNWRTQPQAMLMARATGEICRLIAADAILGIAYTVEELSDGTDTPANPPGASENATDTAAGTGKRRMARRKPATPPAELEQPEPEPPEPAEPEPEPDDKPTRAQTEKAMAMFTEQGYHERPARLTATSAILKHPVESWTTITRDEASTVIDTLEQLAAGTAELIIEAGEWSIIRTEPDNDGP